MSLSATVLQDAIIQVGNDKSFMDFEARIDNYGAFKLFTDGADTLLPKSTVEKIKQSARQPEKIPVLNQINTTIYSTYTCNISPDGSTSAFVPVTYITTGFDIGITPALNADNYISAAEDLAWQMKQGFKNVYASVLEADAVAFLETNKSLTNLSPTSLFPGSSFAAGVYTIPDNQRNTFYAKIPTIFRRNVIPGQPADLANTEATPNYEFIANQGPGNAQNTAYQTAQVAKGQYRSNFVTVAAGQEETHFLCPIGGVGVYNWLPWEAKNKIKINESTGWDNQTDPIGGMDWQIFYNYACSGGQFTQAWSYRASFAFVGQYSSDPNKSSILKYQIAAAV